MIHIKLYESFNVDSNLIQDMKDIFTPVCDHGLVFSDVYEGIFLSMGDKDVIKDHSKLERPIVSGIAVRLDIKGLKIDNEFIEDLKYSILHAESLLNYNLHIIYISSTSPHWFKSVDSLDGFLKSSTDEKDKHHISKISAYSIFIDIIFKTKE